jgi:hypothetical protein
MQCYDATAISIMLQACVVECCADERQLAAGMSPQNTCSIQLLTPV